jgi:transmembrane sensor
MAMSPRIEARAADWVARRNGGLSATEQAELAAWMAQDPRHAEALAIMEQTWSQLNAPRRLGQADRVWHEVETLHRHRSRGRRMAWVSVGAAAALAVMIAVRTFLPIAPEAAPAVVNLPAIRALADGSKVALRAGAAIEVDFTAVSRRVLLVRGEAMFSVAHDPGRPFVVRSGNVEVRAVGTEFSVAPAAGATAVYVTEGRIAVTQVSAAAASATDVPSPIYAVAGERVLVPAVGPSGARPAVTRLSDTEIASALAWRGERLELSEVPLAEALRMINRGREVPIVLADAEVGRRTITGVLWADDGDGFVRLLEQGFDLSAERDGKVVRLRARQDR